ncbi:MAG: peptidyl-prolyl cis-trans isomerase [Candidatus Latescibacterota bacterium]|jgi:foldase protein PrsA
MYFFGTVLMVALAWGCSQPQVPIADGAVARIDSTTVSAEELRAFVEGISPGLRVRAEGAKARRQYVRSILAKHLLLIEAHEQLLHEDPTVRAEFRRLWRQRLVEAYRQQILPGEVLISEEDVRAYFAASGLDRRREMAGILVEDEGLAQQIHTQLAAGADFVALAREHTIDERSRQQGGVLGFIDLLKARDLQVPDAVFRDLPSGQFSAVLPMGRRFQIVRFNAEQPVPFSERRAQIHELLYSNKFGEAEAREVSRLERKLDLKMVAQGLALLLEKGSLYTRLRRAQLSDEESEVSLFTYKGGRITLGDYVDILSKDLRALSGWGLSDSTEVQEAASSLVLGKVMLFEGAKRGGIADRPEERQWAKGTRERLLIEELRRREVLEKAEVSRQEARNYYEDNESLFKEADGYILVEVLVKDEVEAKMLRKKIDEGETLSALAEQYTQRSGMKEEAGLLHMDDYERLAMPQLYRAVIEAEIGQVVGPVSVREGHSLFKVLDHQPGALKPFDDVERKARALVRGQKKEALFEAFVDALMAKYAERFAVSEEALEHALPDTFLARLTAGD